MTAVDIAALGGNLHSQLHALTPVPCLRRRVESGSRSEATPHWVWALVRLSVPPLRSGPALAQRVAGVTGYTVNSAEGATGWRPWRPRTDNALVAGTTDAAVLTELGRGRLPTNLPALSSAPAGRFRGQHAFLVSQMLAHLGLSR